MATKIANVRGPTGNQGAPGNQGATGSTGPAGTNGATGAQGNPGPRSVSTDAGNTAVLGSDTLAFVPAATAPPLATSTQNGSLRQTDGLTTSFFDGTNTEQDLGTAITPTIYDIRTRSINVLGNPNFEVDQRKCSTLTTFANSNGWALDRWWTAAIGTGVSISTQQINNNTYDPATGSTYMIGHNCCQIKVAAQKATLAAGDYCIFYQKVEGPSWRPISGGASGSPHSITIQMQSSGPAQKIGFFINSPTVGRCLTKLCQLRGGNAVDTFYFPNLPAFPMTSAPFSLQPGTLAYTIGICLGAGSTYTSTANDTWLTTASNNYTAALGQDNFLANPVGTTLNVSFFQHEPSAYCSPFIECPFEENHYLCKRYYCKNGDYANIFPTSGAWSGIGTVYNGQTFVRANISWPTWMATVPTVSIAGSTGTLNQVYLDVVGNVAIAASSMIDTAGLGTITLSAAATSSQGVLAQWQADTNW